MAGPIDFASDGPVDRKGPTEHGGTAGLIESGSGSGPAGVFAHSDELLSASEKRGIMVRARAGVKVDPVTGFEVGDASADAVDPATGRVVGAWNEPGNGGGAPVDTPPKTQAPK